MKMFVKAGLFQGPVCSDIIVFELLFSCPRLCIFENIQKVILKVLAESSALRICSSTFNFILNLNYITNMIGDMPHPFLCNFYQALYKMWLKNMYPNSSRTLYLSIYQMRIDEVVSWHNIYPIYILSDYTSSSNRPYVK